MTSTGADDRLRILLVNWQDRENPQAGGAEIHLHEIFGRLAGRGHEVRAVVGGWPGAPARTTLDGIGITRVGGRFSFPFGVRKAVRQELATQPADVVIEDINKVPLYAPRWLEVPVVALVPHLFGGTAFSEASWPVASVVWAAERRIPAVYAQTPFQVISESTADDLETRGIDRARIRVIHPGIDHSVFAPSPETPRENDPTVLYVGRLKRYKGIDHVLRAIRMLRETIPELRFDIAGRGDDLRRLERLVSELGLSDTVRFLGFVPEDEKVDRLRRAWVAVYPSPKEGWGIVNVEAAACGTPVVASDSPGLRESVAAGASGFLVEHGDPQAWADALRSLLRDSGAADRMSAGCVEHAARFSWDRAADETEAHLETVLADRVRQHE
ncbi:MAG: glycosyltransferase family 4 protein [Gemmatimonadota bacterium]|nr:glycosyltransferase family 4 protein [Gemmatimonadota bacterium]